MKMRKTGQEIVLPDVLIEDAGAEGMAVARVDGMVVFVPFAVPGDVVDVKLFRKKKNYAEGRVVAVKSPSPKRATPQCPHFGVCGGCKWQNMQYDEQLRIKQKLVKDNLERLGHIDTSSLRPICGSEQTFYYRNKLEFTFSAKRWRTPEELASGSVDDGRGALGFHLPTVFDKALDISHCALQRDPSNAIRLAVADYARSHGLPFYDIRSHEGFLRNLVVRCSSTGEWMVVVVVARRDDDRLMPLLQFLCEQFPQITSLQYIVNEKLNDSYTDQEVITYRGKDHMLEQMKGYRGETLHFKIQAKSFYQTNSEQAARLYSFVAAFADLRGDETVYDLYTGTGTIALFLAAQCKRVIGIEYIEAAIADARDNAVRNGLQNTEFFAGDMAKVFTADFVAAHGVPDVVVTDPPRAGMHEKVVEQLLDVAPRCIVYVSCNPATQARDLALLSVKYDVDGIQPVDMFPHTQHVENVVKLIRRQA